MDRTAISDLAHAQHPIASPVDDAVEQLLRAALQGQGSVLDLGCGDGTWLLRALRQDPGLRAVGVDLSGAGFERVLADAGREGLASRLELRVGDARDFTWAHPFDVVVSIGATHAFGGLLPTVAAAGSHLRRGGRVLVGECFWEQPPSRAALQSLGVQADDFQDLAGTVAAITEAGWVPVTGHVSSVEEWDEYEWSWIGSLVRWAQENVEHPDSDEVLQVAAEHRWAWLEGYRGVLGFVTLLLAAAPQPVQDGSGR